MRKYKELMLFISIVLVFITLFVSTYLIISDEAPQDGAQPLSHEEFEETASRYEALIAEQDPSASFTLLRNTISSDTAIARECHPLLHRIGHAAYDKYRDFKTAVSYQDGLCNSGYTHGVIEAHFKASTDIETTLQTTCSMPESLSFQDWQCAHGIGHGAMYYNKKDVAASTKMCESLPNTSAQSACVNGVYMERFIIVSHTGGHTSSNSDISPSLCTSQPEQYKVDCYLYAPTAYLQRQTNDYSGAIKECRTVESNFIGVCIQGVGSQAVKENPTKPQVAEKMCTSQAGNYKESCIEGAVSLLINHYGATTPVEPLCNTTFRSYTSLCKDKIRSWNAMFAPQS